MSSINYNQKNDIDDCIQINNFDNEDKNMKLGDRMKRYEKNNDPRIESDKYFCIRLDGRSFSKFTRGFQKPYDSNFSKAMVKTTYEAMCEFGAVSGYTQSDEITLIFTPIISKGTNQTTIIFDGRINKILTLMSSFVSVRFNFYLNKFINENNELDKYKPDTLSKIQNSSAIFDARVLIFDENNKKEILNHIIWRSTFDCYRNSVSTYGYHLIGHNQIKNLNSLQIIELLKTKNIDWDNDVPLWQKYGVFIKKQFVTLINDKGEEYQRTIIKPVSFKLNKFSENLLNFFISKYYNQELLSDINFQDYII